MSHKTSKPLPTLVEVPCLSGAAWDTASMTNLVDYTQISCALDDDTSTVEEYADTLEAQVAKYDDYVLIGDSFGALVALALATRRPKGLRGLVISGGFAVNPVEDWFTKLKLLLARSLPKWLYLPVTLRLHARALASREDAMGSTAWSARDTYRLFVEHTPYESYVVRSRASQFADYSGVLDRIEVPTLILTPSDDTLIGKSASKLLRDGIKDAREIVLPHTGHMFRFSHPDLYSLEVAKFLNNI